MTVQENITEKSLVWEEVSLLSKDDLKKCDPRKIPKHIAIIPDGNRRWAKQNFILPEVGHRIGAQTLLDIIKSSKEIGVKTLTFYIFSTENWARPKREIKAQMWLLEKSLREQKQRMLENGVRFRTIGQIDKFPEVIINLIHDTVEATKNCDQITVVFAMNYGGRDDIKRACCKITEDCTNGKIKKEEITEKLISSYLDTAEWGDPDLLIRTSGESRISNFLLWQLSYAEIYLSKTFWPEFTPKDLLHAVCDYQNRERRQGGS